METSILIMDDSKAVRQQILDILKKTSPFESYYEAGDGFEGFKIVLSRPVDVILCDLEMPGMDGFKFLSMIKAREELRNIPVIMLTGHEDRNAKIRGLEQGASDFVTKPFDPEELMARVKVQFKIKSLQDELKKSNQLLLELSNTDPLTNLFNRRCLMETLNREFERSKRTKNSLSLIIVDIDHCDILPPLNRCHDSSGGFLRPVLIQFGTFRCSTCADMWRCRGTLYANALSERIS
jgi:PleD family two-component response regulator